MIEKLDLRENTEIIPIKGSCHDYCLAKSSVLIKINELVDAVNKMQEQVAILEEYVHPTAKTEPYAEQRKWIGKLCWFWDTQEEYKFVGILGEVSDNGTYFQKDGIVSYLNCEPVKPDDDIIYKGE